MHTKFHPTHARRTRIELLHAGAVAILCWTAGYGAQQVSRNQPLVDLLMALFLAAGLFCLLLAVARAYVCRCPDCGRVLLHRQRSGGKSRKSVCSRCRIVWDTGIELELGGE